MSKCINCGNELKEESSFCDKCGIKIKSSTDDEIASTNEIPVIIVNIPKTKLKKIMFTVVSIIFILALGAGGWYYNNHLNEQKHNYENDLKSVVNLMFDESAKSESIINIYSKVWSGSILAKYGLFINADSTGKIVFSEKRPIDDIISCDNYLSVECAEKRKIQSKKNAKEYAKDFNDALRIVNNLLDEQGKITSIVTSKKLIGDKMQLLNNPPKEYKTAYEMAFELYGFYNQYVSLAESPTGSLTSFNQKTGELSSEIIKKVKDFQIRLPSK